MNFWEAYLAAKEGKIIRVVREKDDIRFVVCCKVSPTNRRMFILFDLDIVSKEEDICWDYIDKCADDAPRFCLDSLEELKFSIVSEEEMFDEMRRYVNALEEDEC